MSFRHALLAVGPILLSPMADAAERPVVIELFTSQGCSSCPPAEALLGEYAGRADVLPLGFHVTYWNRLGWRDTFSFDGATARQDAYAKLLGTDSPFTPEIVVDGSRSVVGSRRDEVAKAVAKASAERDGEVAIDLTRHEASLSLRIGAGRGSARVLLIGFDRRQVTPIARGENGGRTVTQSNVVRTLRSIGTWDGTARTFDEPWPSGQEAAVLLQASDGRILGAARLSRT